MTRTATIDAETRADQLIFTSTAPEETEGGIYDYPGEYALRFDAVDEGDGMADLVSWPGTVPLPAGEYVNEFECIPMS